MKIIEELKSIQQDMFTQLPAEVLNVMGNSLSEMLTQNLDCHAIKSGDTAPDFSLVAPNNQKIELYKLLETKSVILSFFRGSWCPFCVKELEHFNQNLKLILDTQDVHFIAISPQKPDISAQLIQEHNINLTILSDTGNQIAKQYGLVFTLPENVRNLYKNLGANLPDFNGDDSYQLPIPATYIIDQNKKVIFSYINVNYMERADTSELIKALKKD